MGIDDIVFGLGFVAVTEGLVLALAPSRLGDILRRLDEIPPETRRMAGLAVTAFGIVLLWIARA